MTNIVTVDFRGDTLFGFKEGDRTFIALKPIVDAMGMNWSGQEQRVKRDPILSEGVCVMHIPFGRGGAQEAICIDLELVNGWLFTIDSSRIKDEAVREKVLTYQRECYRVLHDHFAGMKKAMPPEIGDDEEPQESDSVKIRLVNACRPIFGNRAAAQLWFKVGLPVVPDMLQELRQVGLFDLAAVKTVNEDAA